MARRLLVLLLPGCATVPTVHGAPWTEVPMSLSVFECTDHAAWQEGGDQEGPWLELSGASRYVPPHRSPLSMALLQDGDLGDFELEVAAQQTGREYPHRDLVLVFAWRDAAHFAYAHLASQADDNAHQLMLVDGADRRPVTTVRTTGVAWSGGWHELRLRRRGERVEVWFDGGEPVLVGTVPPWRGRIGFGSFDDTGRFRTLRLRAATVPRS